MALTNCKDCGREISTSAQSCPGCGAPVQQQPKKSAGTSVGCLAILVIVGFLAVVVATVDSPSGSGSSTSTTPAEPRHPFETAQPDGAPLRAQVRRLINSDGERCDAVANLRGGGKTESGDVFILADCAGGDTHAMLVTPANQIRYYMSCESAFNPVC